MSTNNTVEILNPATGGSRYTSRKNAHRLVTRGIAAYARDGAAIMYADQQWLRIADAQAFVQAQDDRFIEQRGGVLWWNGSDNRPNACHRPGENVVFPRPNNAKPYMAAMERMRESV